MEKFELDELRKRKKDQVIKLIEVADLTRQIAETVDRGDRVSAQMLLNEREQPLRELREMEEGIRAFLAGCSEQEAIRFDELLHGAEGATDEEKALAAQVAQFHRTLASVRSQDEQLSVRLGGSRSFYKKYR